MEEWEQPHEFKARWDLEGREPDADDECGICNLLYCTDIHVNNRSAERPDKK